MSAKTILYVEDNEVNRRLVQDILRPTSYKLLEAPDGESGMAMARKEHPDLILMDVQLPKVSGIEATRTLRGEPGTANTPIIAITSFALAGDEQKAIEARARADDDHHEGALRRSARLRLRLCSVRLDRPDARDGGRDGTVGWLHEHLGRPTRHQCGGDFGTAATGAKRHGVFQDVSELELYFVARRGSY
ncbi:MAG: hypothetical protein DMD77_18915 [Candidatus Rokuibacteriota bacterium]|nr:MAG: hypothetical protein DMD77_18915 [Candidatus Rokubacteria bacterium]